MKNTNTPKQQQGATIIEVMIAILIFSMGIMALMGLQATAVSNNSAAKYRADASFYAEQIIGQMWANGGTSTLASYACNPCNAGNGNADTQAWFTQMQNNAATRSGLPSAQASIVIGGALGQTATITIQWLEQTAPPGATPHSYVAITDVTKNIP